MRKFLKLISGTGSLAALLAGLAATAQADQIVNGGFEQPTTATFTDVVAPDSSTIPGWSVTNGSVDVVNAAGNGFDVGPAYQGNQYLDLNGTNAGTIAQTFATTSGTTYQLTFAYANNYDPPTSLSAQVTVADGNGNNLLSTVVNHSSSVAGNLNWTLFDQSFTADQSSAVLSFKSLNDGAGGVFLDAISITAVPEPRGCIPPLLLCSAAGCLGLRVRRRSRGHNQTLG